MKLRIASLFTLFTVLFTVGLQAGENPFAPHLASTPPPAPANANPFAAPDHSTSEITPPTDSAQPTNPFATPHPVTGNPPAEASPFVSSSPESTNLAGHPLASTNENPFASPSHSTSSTQTDSPKELTKDHHTTTPLPSTPSHGHLSTAQRTESIKTLHITPGHSTVLIRIAFDENVRYIIQDKKYESYLSSTIEPAQGHEPKVRVYIITIPATIHAGSFTVFKTSDMQGIPAHLEPAYHVEIQGNDHEIINGTQYPAPDTSSAVEKLTQLEEKYSTAIQTQFKAFTQEVRELISTAHKNGESLEAAKLHEVQIVTTEPPLALTLNESHVVTSFTGGSAQSSNPTIVSAALKFEGTKTNPQWKLILTAHKVGEAIITYSSDSKSHVQSVTVTEKASADLLTKHPEETNPEKKEEKIMKKKATLPPHSADEESHEKATSSLAATLSGSSEEEDSEGTDEKMADELADSDEPFASFLKDTPNPNSDTQDQEESSEDQPIEASAPTEAENTSSLAHESSAPQSSIEEESPTPSDIETETEEVDK